MNYRAKERIIYLLDRFPTLSETFIVNEINQLRVFGLDIQIVALWNPNENIAHEQANKLSVDVCYYSRYVKSNFVLKILQYLFFHCYYLLTIPYRYFKTFRLSYGLGGGRYLFRQFRVAPSLAFMIKKYRPIHIHAHFADTASEYAMLLSSLTGTSYSFTIHAHDIFLYFKYIEEKARYAKFTALISQYNKNFVTNKCENIDEEKMHIIRCGVDLEKIDRFEVNDGVKSESFTISSVGRLVEIKGFQYLIRACKTLLERGLSDFKCYIIGDGPLRGGIEKNINDFGLSNTIYLQGALKDGQVYSFIKKSDVCVLASVPGRNGDMDGIPVFLMEAMAFRKPVISTEISGIPELVKDGAGILVPAGEPEKLADALEEIYFLDEVKRSRMGEMGRRIVEREFNIVHESKKLMDRLLS